MWTIAEFLQLKTHNICINIRKRAAGLLPALFSGLLPAQVIPPHETEFVELDPFVAEVYAIPDANALLDMPGQLLGNDELVRKLEASLGETLAWEPGVSSTFYGPAASRPVIRGQTGYRVGIYSGGVGMGDLSNASPDHAVASEPLFIEEVEIIRGPAALLYGSNAIGGAVDVVTNYIPRRAATRPVSGDLAARYDTVSNGRTSALAVTVGEDRLVVQANGLWRETDSYKIPGFARTPDYDANNRSRLPPAVPQPGPNPEGEVPNTQSSTQMGTLGASWIADTGWIGGAFTAYQTDYGVPTDGHSHGNPFAPPGTGPGPNDAVTIEMQQRKGDLEGEFWPDNAWLGALSLRAVYADLKQDEFEGAFLGNHFDSQTFEGRLEAVTENLSAWTLAAGGQFNYFSLHNRNINYVAGRADSDSLDTRSLAGGLFGLAEYNDGPWEAELGTRFDLQNAQRSDLSGASRTNTAYSVSLGAAYRLAPEGRVGLQLSHVQRIPTADELYVEAPHSAIGIFQIPNPNLANERSWGMDVYLEKDRGSWTFNLTGFLRHFDNYIYLENQGFEVDGLPAYQYIQSQANFLGAEFSTEWTLLEGNGRLLTLSGLWDVVYGTDISRGQPLPRIPPMRLGGRLDYEVGSWSFGVGLRHAFAQNRVPAAVFGTLDYQSPTASYTFLDAHIAYAFQWGELEGSIYLDATNLANAEGRNAVSFLKDVAPLPGRNFALGVNVFF